MSELAKAIAPVLCALLADPAVATALRAVLAPPATSEPIAGLVAKADAARALGVSLATIDRFVVDGAPVEMIGARRRFDVAKLRAWCAERGRKAAPTKKTTDTIDVGDVTARAGLRVAR